MILLVLLAGILNMLISFLILRRRSVLLIILHFWWFGWLLLSLFSLTGLYPPSNFTVWLFILLLSSSTIGAGIYTLLRRYTDDVPKYAFFSHGRQTSIKLESATMRLALFTTLPFTGFFFLRSLLLMAAEPSLSIYRAKVFGIGLGYPLLFHYPLIYTIDEFVIEPINLAALFIGVAAFVQYGRYRLLATAIVMIILHSIMMMGRFGFHIIFMMLVLMIAYRTTLHGRAALRSLRGMILVFFGVFIFAAAITFMRSATPGKGLDKVITMYAIDYHTVSFSIFDHDLHDEKSVLHFSSYGRSSLGPFDRVMVQALKLFGIQKNAQPDLNGLALTVNREVGRDATGNPKLYNAFGSVAYSLYRDGKLLFVAFAGAIFGFFISFYTESLRYKSVYGTALLTALAFIGIYGIFQPVLEGPIYLAILAIFFLQKIAGYQKEENAP